MAYFVTKSTLQPKNKLQAAAQESIKPFHQVLTDKTPEEMKAHFETALKKLNEQHPKCTPLTFRFNDNRGYDMGFSIGFGSEAHLIFTKVYGTMESNFNVQTQI